jgi:SAM-dependent methyltransferase
MSAETGTLADTLDHDVLRRAVRERYARVATTPATPLGFPVGRAFAQSLGYPPELLDRFPEAAASFTGVGTPVSVAQLQPGETVLELGCGAGLDTIWAASALEPGGQVIALDMALPMLMKLQANVQQTGGVGVLPLQADAEATPLADASVDVVLVNGIFNLSPDKAAVLREIRRVLRPTGRLVASEVVLTRPLDPGEASTLDDWFR